MKKRIFNAIFVVLIAITFIFQIPLQTFADSTGSNTTSQTKYNIELLLDKSGSMNNTDPDHMAQDAACMFIDQLSVVTDDLQDLATETNVGVMSFGQSTEVVAPITSIDSEANTSYLKNAIESIEYLKLHTGGTDLSVAIYDALRQLAKSSVNGEKKAVILFTDGYSENVLNKATSSQDLQDAFEMAEEMDCQIYVIGLDYNNAISANGRQEIYNISDTTQSKEGIAEKASDDTIAEYDNVNYIITSEMDDIRKFYGDIIAGLNDATIYNFDHEFTVDTTGIREADVTIYSSGKIADVDVTDPSGKRKNEDGTTFFVSGSEYYKVVKIINPEMGTWQVDVAAEEEYETYVVEFYGVQAAVTADWDISENYPDCDLDSTMVGKVTLIPMYKGSVFEDESLSDGSTTAGFTVTGDSLSEKYTMKYNDGNFVGYFPVENGTYEVEAFIKNDVIDKTANCTLIVSNPDSITEDNLGYINVKKTENTTVDLLKETQTEKLTISNLEISDSGSNIANITNNNDGTITITGLNKGRTSFKIEAKDNQNHNHLISGVVIVKMKMMWYYWVIIVLAILVICAAIIFIWYKTRIIRGNFVIKVKIIDPSNDFYEETTEDIEIPSPMGYSFSLRKLTDFVRNYINNLSSEEVMQFEEEISGLLLDESSKISKCKVFISKKNKKKKVYKLKARNIKDLSVGTECYKSSSLSVFVKFNSNDNDDFGDTLEEDSDFGKETAVTRKNKKHGRHSSATFDDDDMNF